MYSLNLETAIMGPCQCPGFNDRLDLNRPLCNCILIFDITRKSTIQRGRLAGCEEAWSRCRRGQTASLPSAIKASFMKRINGHVLC